MPKYLRKDRKFAYSLKLRCVRILASLVLLINWQAVILSNYKFREKWSSGGHTPLNDVNECLSWWLCHSVCKEQHFLDVRGSVHHSIIHTEIANKIQQCIKIHYSMFIWSSTFFGRHTAHHQELKTALAASGFAYVEGCWTLWLLDAISVRQPQRPTTFHVCKTRGC